MGRPPKRAEISDFSEEELLDIQSRLKRRFRKNKNVIEIGLGFAETTDRGDNQPQEAESRGGDGSGSRTRVDRGRGFCVKFYVRRKWRRANAGRADRIPKEVEVALKRKRGQYRFVFPTDLVHVSKPRLSSSIIYAPSEHGLTGMVVTWRQLNTGNTDFWALLTVGHIFSAVGDTAVVYGSNGTVYRGGLIAKAAGADLVDAALVEVQTGDLQAAGVPIGQEVLPLTLQQLFADDGAAGLSMRMPASQPIELRDLIPTCDQIPSLGRLQFVVRAVSSVDLCFAPGTSGAIWEVGGALGGMQIAGTPSQFTEGYAQAATTVLAWAQAVLPRVRNAKSGSVRAVAFF